MPRPHQPTPLLTLRAALILALALTAGVIAGALALWADRSLPEALLAASAAFGSTLGLLHQIISD